MPEIIIVKNEAEAGEIYGRCVADLIKAKPDAVLGLATGSSPLAAYQALAKIVQDESIDVSGVRGFALDEYIGLPLTHPESYHATIHRTVVEPLGLTRPRSTCPVTYSAARRSRTATKWRWPARPMIVPSRPLAASTCRFSSLARTAMRASTSPVPRWPPALASRPWPNRPASTTRASLTTTSTKCPPTASRRVLARS